MGLITSTPETGGQAERETKGLHDPREALSEALADVASPQVRFELLMSWRRSGFSVHNRVHAHPQNGPEFEALVRYMMRSPVSLPRLRFTPGAKEVVYAGKGEQDARESTEDERIDAEDFVARVLIQIPDPRRHLVRYYGPTPTGRGVSAARQRVSSRGTAPARPRSLSPLRPSGPP